VRKSIASTAVPSMVCGVSPDDPPTAALSKAMTWRSAASSSTNAGSQVSVGCPTVDVLEAASVLGRGNHYCTEGKGCAWPTLVLVATFKDPLSVVCRIGAGPLPGPASPRDALATAPRFRASTAWLCLVTGGPLLKRPHVAVRITEI
jgi:hypothetical protein